MNGRTGHALLIPARESGQAPSEFSARSNYHIGEAMQVRFTPRPPCVNIRCSKCHLLGFTHATTNILGCHVTDWVGSLQTASMRYRSRAARRGQEML